MIHYIIPARRNSKGLPFKNRKLLHHTLDILPDNVLPQVIVSTDDEFIINECVSRNVCCLKRSAELSGDNICIRDVMEDCIDKCEISKDDTIVILYLTYPQRTWETIQKALEVFIDKKLDSLLCKKSPSTHPYLCFFDAGKNQGTQVIGHDLYRRQDYPSCFELSFYVCIFKVSKISKLSKNMFCEGTYFFPLNDHLDIDTEQDLSKFMEEKSGHK